LGIDSKYYKKELLNIFEKVNKIAKVKENIKKKINTFDDLIILKSQMHLEGRSDNIIVPTNDLDINNILIRSWRE
jgi:hypothetical protein